MVNRLLGKTLTEVRSMNDEQIFFTTSDGVEYVMEHYQSCCESVYIESIVGDLQDLVGNPILLAEEATNEDNPMYEHDEAFQWTFYKFATIKGYVDIRWYGSSNGYYSVGVDFDEVRKTYY